MKASPFLFAFLLLAAFALTFTACDEEPIEVEETICEESDPDDAMITFFDPYTGTIHAVPSLMDEVADLLMLEAIPSSGEPFYLYQAFTMNGDQITTEVKIEATELEELKIIADAVDLQLEKDVDTYPEGELVSSSRTRRGYECEKVGDARTTRCHVFPSRSSNSYHKARYICSKSTTASTCTDWKAVIGYYYEYYNRACSGDPDTKRSLKGYTCQ